MLDPVTIEAPEGSIVNASFPAASAARAQTGQRIVDVILGALAPAYPEKIIAAGTGANTSAAFFGRSRAGKYYVYLETLGGGAGGRSYKDGTDGVQVHMTNTSNLPIEALETEYPLMIERYELVEDSGGGGQIPRRPRIAPRLSTAGSRNDLLGQGERFVNRPWAFSAENRAAPADLPCSATMARKTGWPTNRPPCVSVLTELSVSSLPAPADLAIRRSGRRTIFEWTLRAAR